MKLAEKAAVKEQQEVKAAQPQVPAVSLSGLERASILIISLGADVSSHVLQQLTPDEIERLASEILKLKKIDAKLRKQVIMDARKTLLESPSFGGMEYAQTVLSSVFGESKARELLSKLSTGGDTSTLRWIRGIPPRQLAQAIKNERPQVVALVLGHLLPDQAAQVISSLPEETQGDVVLRLTTMQPCDPEVIRNLNHTLLARLSTSENSAFTEVGGNESVVQILNSIDRSTERKIMEYLDSVDQVVATQIKENMFVFEDILKLDDRTVQTILKEVPQEDLRLALKGEDEESRAVFYRNMSSRAAETLKEDMESSGPVKLKDVESAQSRIVSIARLLDENGEINMRDSDEDIIS